MCAEDKGVDSDGKGNLAVNYKKGVYKCWACYERNNMHGSIVRLIKKYGNRQLLRDYLLVAPDFKYGSDTKAKKQVFLRLPKGFKKFSESTMYDEGYKVAYEYVKSRGLTDDLLERYNIGFTIEGKKRNRIIIPSYNLDGKLEYYIARSWVKWNKFKYLNPEAEKEEIIFNENLINWDSTIYLVEGVFDHIVTPNSIPMLGKVMSDKLFFALLTKAKGNIVLVLDGGEEEREDALTLYTKLNTLSLYNRIRIVNLPDNWDLSLLNQKFGKSFIIKYLRKAFKVMESRL